MDAFHVTLAFEFPDAYVGIHHTFRFMSFVNNLYNLIKFLFKSFTRNMPAIVLIYPKKRKREA